MPYKLQKSKRGWRVVNRETGRAYSKKPMPKERAKRQLAALHIHTDESVDHRSPRMTEVFRVDEISPQNRSLMTGPPPGSMKAPVGLWNQLGKAGKLAQDGLEAMNDVNPNDYDPMVTPDGQVIAYPKVSRPDQPPIMANLAKGGLWSPLDSDSSGSGGM